MSGSHPDAPHLHRATRLQAEVMLDWKLASKTIPRPLLAAHMARRAEAHKIGLLNRIMSTFKFHPKWNGGLYCVGPGGTLELELPMVILTAYLPTEDLWRSEAPDWAKDQWPLLRHELEAWCHKNKINFVIDSVARIY